NGECPMPVISASTPADCFEVAYEAVRLAVTHMTPVIFLSDGYIANGSEPWRFPTEEALEKITTKLQAQKDLGPAGLLPYSRNEFLVRPWIKPGTKGMEHRIGGLEKQDGTGNVSYD